MIFHIAKAGEWAAASARGHYAPASLSSEGFIHCSTLEQVPATASRFFRGQRDLVVLCIDEQRLTARLEFESPRSPEDPRDQQRFPHVYGPLNAEAVSRVVPLPADGSFPLPAQEP